MIEKSVPIVSKIVFTFISSLLALSALGLIILHMETVFHAFTSWRELELAIIQMVEYVVIGLAIFDVARFVLEEEVLAPSGARRSEEAARLKLTRFMIVIVVAVALEAIMKILRAGGVDETLLKWAAVLLTVDAFLLVGLGGYLRLSASAEHELHLDEAETAKQHR